MRRAQPVGLAEPRHPSSPPARSWRSSTTTRVPDPWWLDDVVPAFDDPEVAAAGGPVYDFDGALCSRCTRSPTPTETRRSRLDGPNPTRASRRAALGPLRDADRDELGVPAKRASSPSAASTRSSSTSSTRPRSAAVSSTKAGSWRRVSGVTCSTSAFPSARRTDQRVTRDMFPVLRSRMYFALRHALPRSGLLEVMRRYERDRRALPNRLVAGRSTTACSSRATSTSSSRTPSERSTTRWRALAASPQTRPPSWFDENGAGFVALRRTLPARRLHVCIVSHEYPPKQLNGIGRLSHELAVALAEKGHVVRVLTEGLGHEASRSRMGFGYIASCPSPRSRLRGSRRRPGSGTSRHAPYGSCAGSTTRAPSTPFSSPTGTPRASQSSRTAASRP